MRGKTETYSNIRKNERWRTIEPVARSKSNELLSTSHSDFTVTIPLQSFTNVRNRRRQKESRHPGALILQVHT